MGDTQVKINDKENIEELSGDLSNTNEEDKLMHSVLENDKETIDDGKLISDAINQGLGSFIPDMMYEQLVRNYKTAKQIYGETIIRELTGYDPDYVEKNINVPEFKKKIQENINKKVKDLKKKKLLDAEGITEKGLHLASLVMYVQELDNLIPKGFYGDKIHKKSFIYGERENISSYKKGDKYRDIELRKSIKTAVRRSHTDLKSEDLRVSQRKGKGQIHIVYALDSSGSMKGKKIETAKKAGIALSYKAINNHDKVGLIVFGSEIEKTITPTLDFPLILREIVSVRTTGQTDIAKMIENSLGLFPETNVTKHLIILTDALATAGDDPENQTIKSCSVARSKNITISVAGINLDREGKKLAEEMTRIGEGRLYNVKNLEELDKIILEDYYAFS